MVKYGDIDLDQYSVEDRLGLINSIISILSTSEEDPFVSKLYSNRKTVSSEVQAYAKISGKEWTFYVKSLQVTLGRNTDTFNLMNNVLNDQATQPDHLNPIATGLIDIDLGPAKIVSRKHATITFNRVTGFWQLLVPGRNGAKINFKRVKAGKNAEPVDLKSGDIIDVGGVQMMFILPDQEPVVPYEVITTLIPKLVTMYGLSGNNNKLLCAIINNSEYVKKQKQLGYITFHLQENGSTGPMKNEDGNNNEGPDESIFNNAIQSPSGPLTQTLSVFPPPTATMSHNNSNMASNIMSNPISSNKFKISNSKSGKPSASYATLITQAILSSPEGIISLSDIYKFIENTHEYYKTTNIGWQNSVRHNLSLNPAFEKVPRKPHESGKGMKWRINESFKTDFLKRWSSGKISKLKKNASVDRQLFLHMSKFNELPGEKPLQEENVPKKVHTQIMTSGQDENGSAYGI
ncbi:hypothetical protein KAFR_0J01720 [Kazachstania africana CBS 2517]|uniref:Fork-head domain-containing protein n=1 Tax=Kazachstania africana (strain ATCC 22294 / BCRC 22015 / CBS 2517 / CECT 1963 / NBRC 1671 / NRRL Y-8276) TaxID=1071382 RepID=H2B0T6_KAZAF|nr:hypothetical protein KAFR_0J01720 [Kazachstania africana CBS 2517]CCF60236.1 hypothetical protein KAFR_0J01720 [Kazachstania africana CBS 2517]